MFMGIKTAFAESYVEKLINLSKGKTKKIEIIQKYEDEIKKNIISEKTTFLQKKNPREINDPKEIEQAVDLASEKTGVRKDFLMGMLVVESDLGRNTGKCTYSEVEREAKKSHENGRLSATAWETFKERRDTIKDLAESLHYDYQELKVSCNPGNYYGTGGALGIPQFMPDTWLEYQDRLKEVLQKENPDPWEPLDGVMAMALKLSDVPGVLAHDLWSERNAAKLYLSGTTSWRYDWYANQMIYWSRNYRYIIG